MENELLIRPYEVSDQAAAIALFQQHVPRYFAQEEVAEYRKYLAEEKEAYYVVVHAGNVIAAGGINYFSEAHTARISWDAVDLNYQGKGVGARLLQFRLDRIQAYEPRIQRVIVRTSQVAYRFYEKMGFSLIKVEQNFWAEGFDLYEMELIFVVQ